MDWPKRDRPYKLMNCAHEARLTGPWQCEDVRHYQHTRVKPKRRTTRQSYGIQVCSTTIETFQFTIVIHSVNIPLINDAHSTNNLILTFSSSHNYIDFSTSLAGSSPSLRYHLIHGPFLAHFRNIGNSINHLFNTSRGPSRPYQYRQPPIAITRHLSPQNISRRNQNRTQFHPPCPLLSDFYFRDLDTLLPSGRRLGILLSVFGTSRG